ncbi:MAG TPA: peptide ligase PGM1-related protein, partial [Gemmatimonadales bacterium]|nr:peptide ligase PGM1-related protein [Gemmatimonadales bacterium]
ARSRLTMLCAHDASPRSLTEKILERPRLIERIRQGIADPGRAYLTVFNSTPLERKLAVLLGIPLNGVDPALAHLGTKSGGRKVFREAGVAAPLGFEDLRTETEVVEALAELKGRRPELRRAVIKLNDSFSGEGNALVRYRAAGGREAPRAALEGLEFAVDWETREAYFDKLSRMGGVVEEFIEGPEKASPSAQLRVTPHGRVELISTHDQILGGPGSQVFLGCSFPAHDDYRLRIQEEASRIGEVLARRGVVSRFGVDFLLWRELSQEEWQLAALEINLRMGGTTHPYLALRFLTGGDIDSRTGLFVSPAGKTKYYRATDNLRSEAYRGLLPEDLIDILTYNKLHYHHASESGVLFHMIGAASEFGKLGLTAIGNSRAQVEELYGLTLAVLDHETSWGRRFGGSEPEPEPQLR